MKQPDSNLPSASDVAIIGLACRYPGAEDAEAFWRNLRDGSESITYYTDEELLAAGVPAQKLRLPNYVKAGSLVADVDKFDARFFGFSPRDAAILDPQNRILLECAWHALENSGYCEETQSGPIGVFAGSGMIAYFIYHLLRNQDLVDSVGEWLLRHTGNDKDFLATRISYQFNLTGPSVNVQTACSTSLVATHYACQSLINGECDMAIAGGVYVRIPHRHGYLHKEGEILSPDGHCRSFDSKAQGTLFGSGVGTVVLKRLGDAIDDGDSIRAVIKGSAVNNDGSRRVGYMAPGVEGQARVIAEALAVAGVSAETINYVETHGTATIVGDPIEVSALTRAFRETTDRKNFCAIGSVKTNMGHTSEAAGVAGLIKTVLSLQHRQIPPSLHFVEPNPEIDFNSSPFFVNTKLREWTSDGPRRAGVSSWGVGGTNAHLIVEEAPALESTEPAKPWQLLVLSAKSQEALDTATKNLAEHLKAHPDLNLADAAFTLQVGRKRFNHRRVLACRDVADAVAAIEGADPARLETVVRDGENPPVAFLFTGQGSQYVNMGADLYESEPVFRGQIDRCADILQPILQLDLRSLLFAESERAEWAGKELLQTAMAQPALFVIEYAMARLLLERGVSPKSMIGHSMGEYVAACLAGVFSLEEALKLVAIRGRLMQQMPVGAMLAVVLSEEEILPRLGRDLSLAAANGPALCVVSGPETAIETLKAELEAGQIACRRLHTSHAFHSRMMEPMLAPFREELRKVALHSPQIPFVSNVTGDWITPSEATDPEYWVKHARQAVRFSDGLTALLKDPDLVLLELGPGQVLSTFVRQHPARTQEHSIRSSLRHPKETKSDVAVFLEALGQLWQAGASIDWKSVHSNQRRRRIPLPGYPFARERHWIELPAVLEALQRHDQPVARQPDIADWFSIPSWKREPLAAKPDQRAEPSCWLIFDSETKLGSSVAQRLRSENTAARKSEPVRLELSTPGDIGNFSIVPDERREPGDNEVEIEVRAAGLNFKDVLIALGMYAGPADTPIGIESSGVVVRVGKHVKEFRVGDEVIAGSPGSFRSHVIRHVHSVVRKPASLSFEEAASIPGAYLTACYSLEKLAKLKKGEKILIHAATGGVGLAAVRIATALGAEIFATAGNPEKRKYLESLGIRHVFNSRTVEFYDQVMEATGGRGVDVVLNSLTGEFLAKSLALLAPGGRFLELGKKEVYADSRLGLQPYGEGRFYAAIAMDDHAKIDPEGHHRYFLELMDRFEKGDYKVLPIRVFPFEQAAEAFRFMMHTKHIGKVMLSFQPEQTRAVIVRPGSRFQKTGPDAYEVDPDVPGDFEALLRELSDARQTPDRILHLWNVTAKPIADRDMDAVGRHSVPGFHSLIHLMQAWGGRHADQPAHLGILSNHLQALGGVAGDPAKALLLGPARVLPREFPSVTCSAIDIELPSAGSEDETRLVEQLVEEFSAPAADGVVAYRGLDRWLEQFEPSRLEKPASGSTRLRQGGVYLITGGLGGLGLEIAGHLARTCGAKVVLIGRKALPRRENWETCLSELDADDSVRAKIEKILAIEKLGAEVLVASADAAGVSEMRQVLETTRKRFGAVHGIIHAAGVLHDGIIQLKQKEHAEAVLAPKVRGTLVLEEVFRDEKLDFCVFFSSISSILGPAGQVDYAAANAFLDVFARSGRTIGGRVPVAINWGAWKEVGMAFETAGRRPNREKPTRKPEHPLLQNCFAHADGGADYTTEFRLGKYWVLDEHRFRGGDALLPGTGHLELARAAVEDHTGANAVEIRDVFFMKPFVVKPEEIRELRVELTKDGDAFNFVIKSAPSRSDTWEVHVTGSAAVLATVPEKTLALEQIRGRCRASEMVFSGKTPQSHFQFGPRWGNIRRINFGKDEAVVTLELPEEFADDLEHYQLHPALLDLATGSSQPLIDGFNREKDLYVPFSYKQLKKFRRLPRKLSSHVRLLKNGDGTHQIASFDITLVDEEGRELVEIREFSMRKVTDKAAMFPERDPAPRPALTSPLDDAISTAEGLEALQRILDSGAGPQLVVLPQNLRQMIRSRSRPVPSEAASQEESKPSAGPQFSRPNLSTTFEAPRNQVEEQIAEIWQDVLGLRQVGVHDSFFDLGGHSLLVTQAVTRMRKIADIDISLQTFFANPTIAKMAGEMGKAKTEGSPRPASGVVAVSREARRVKRSSLSQEPEPASRPE